MIFKIFKKVSAKTAENTEQNQNEGAPNKSGKSKKFLEFIGETTDLIKEEISSVIEKCKDLRKANYDLGLHHLEKGNLSEAIFRFRVMKKIWPDHFDAYFQLAYCLTLREKFTEAKKVLEELLTKNPEYGQVANRLLEHLNQVTSDVHKH